MWQQKGQKKWSGKGGGKWQASGHAKQKQDSDVKRPKDEAGGILGEFSGSIARRGFKYGFIDCLDIKPFGFDSVMVTWDEMKDFQQGEVVIFTCFVTSLGRAQGKDLRSAESDGLQTQLQVQTQPHMQPQLQSQVQQLQVQQQLQSQMQLQLQTQASGGSRPHDEAGGVLGQFMGTITRRGEKYGFLESEPLAAQGYASVLVRWDEMKNFQPSDQVIFTAFITSQGKAQGKDLLQHSSAFIFKTRVPSEETRVPDEEGEVLGEFLGVIVRRANKYGFIESEELQAAGYDSAMVLWDELGNYQQGDIVTFTAFLTNKGKARAKKLTRHVELGNLAEEMAA